MRRGFSGLTNEEEHYCFMGGEEAHGAYACAKLQAKVRRQEATNRKESDAGTIHPTSRQAPTVPEPEG
jgi:hypothetical protein